MLQIETPEAALVRAINLTNRLIRPLALTDIEFGLPETFIQGETNTRILITVVNGHHYTGSDTHYYNRLRIYDYFAGWVLPGNAADYPDVRALMTAMYTRYQLPLDPDDIVNAPILPTATSVVLRARNTSLMFVPNLTVSLPFSG